MDNLGTRGRFALALVGHPSLRSGPQGSRSALAPRLQAGAGGPVSIAQRGRSLRGRRRLAGAAWGVSEAGREDRGTAPSHALPLAVQAVPWRCPGGPERAQRGSPVGRPARAVWAGYQPARGSLRGNPLARTYGPAVTRPKGCRGGAACRATLVQCISAPFGFGSFLIFGLFRKLAIFAAVFFPLIFPAEFPPVDAFEQTWPLKALHPQNSKLARRSRS